MLIIWKRKGLLVPLAFFIGIAIVSSVAMVERNMDFQVGSIQARLMGALAMILSFSPALINYLFTKYFVKNEEVKILTDAEGKQYKLNTYSTFFFIRNKTWTWIFLIGNIIILIYSLIIIIF